MHELKFLVDAKVVYFQIGNTTLSELHSYFKLYWNVILSSLSKGNLILAKKEEIIILL